MLRRTWAIIQKEFIQTWRDRRTLLVELSLPIIQLFLFGYAIRMSVRDVPTVVATQSFDAASQAYVEALETSGFFHITSYALDQADAVRQIDAGHARAGVVIPPDFARRSERNDAEILLLVDGTDVFTAQSAYNAASSIAQNEVAVTLQQRAARAGPAAGGGLAPLSAHVRILYNPNLEDLWFIIPGLLAMLLQTQAVTLTAAAVVREREAGTIEQLLVTPIRSTELMLGKIIPHLLISIINLLTILALSIFWFDVPFRGDFTLFAWLAFMYVFSSLGLGLLVSTVSQNQRQTQQLAAMLSLLGVVLGGFIFPRYSMPAPVRLIGNLFPLTYFIPIARSIVTKGGGLAYFWEEVAALFIYIVVIMLLAVRAFRQEID